MRNAAGLLFARPTGPGPQPIQLSPEEELLARYHAWPVYQPPGRNYESYPNQPDRKAAEAGQLRVLWESDPIDISTQGQGADLYRHYLLLGPSKEPFILAWHAWQNSPRSFREWRLASRHHDLDQAIIAYGQTHISGDIRKQLQASGPSIQALLLQARLLAE